MRWPWRYRGELAKKLALQCMVFSAVVATIVTAAELGVEYWRDVAGIRERVEQVERAALPSIAESVAVADYDRLHSLLRILTQQPDFVLAEVHTHGNVLLRSGEMLSGNGVTRVFVLERTLREQRQPIGELVVQASYQAVRERTLDRLVLFLGANLLKSLVFLGFFFWVFHRMIGRRLVHMTESLHNPEALALADRYPAQPDELGDLAGAIHTMRRRTAALEGEMAKRAAELQERVAQRTNSLAETVARFGKITAQLPGVVYQFCLHADGRTHFPFASEGIRTIYRLSPESVQHDASIVSTIIHPDDLAGVKASITTSARALSPWRHEYRVRFDDGTVRWLFGDALPQAEPDGSVMWFGFITDITERKRVEDELRMRKAELTKILDAFPGAALTVTADLTLLYANQRYAGLLGRSPQELVGRNASEFLTPDRLASMRDHVDRTRDGDAIVFERDYPATDIHGAMTMLGSYVGGQDPRGGDWLCYVFATDVTQLKAAERALCEARNAAQAASLAKSEFLASVSHELRTPLNAILGYSQLLVRDQSLPEFVRSSSHDIDFAGRHLLSLVNGLIDLGRIDSGQLTLSLEQVDLASVVRECMALVGNAAADLAITLSDATAAGCHGVVRADAVRLRQILVNLMSNAIKYNHPGGAVHVMCQPSGGAVRITVSDTGKGIASHLRGRLFNAFDRLGEERGVVEGSGIGLAITQRLVEAMDGYIGFESVPGEGSTFWVEIPCGDGAGAGAPAVPGLQVAAPAAGATLPQQGSATRPVLLYVEDNPMNLRLMGKILALRQDLVLHSAPTAEQGIALAFEQPPALVLMDINLPGMDGYAALAALQGHAATAGVPVIAVSANAMKGDRERGLAAGFVDYLTKPLDVTGFLQRLEELVPRRMPA